MSKNFLFSEKIPQKQGKMQTDNKKNTENKRAFSERPLPELRLLSGKLKRKEKEKFLFFPSARKKRKFSFLKSRFFGFSFENHHILKELSSFLHILSIDLTAVSWYAKYTNRSEGKGGM